MKIPFISAWLEKRSATSSLSAPEQWLVNMFGGSPSNAGVRVTETTAVKMIAVFACVRLLSETIASLPLPLYRYEGERGKKRAYAHPLYSILHDQANTEQTAYHFWQTMLVNALLCGDAYAEIERDEFGTVVGLWPIPSRNVTVERNRITHEKLYRVTLDDDFTTSQPPGYRQVIVYPENMLVIPGIGLAAARSFKPVELFREAVGLGLAAEQFGAEYFGNGVNAGGIVEYPGNLTQNKIAFENMKTSFLETYAGLGKKSRVIFLENGTKFNKISIPNDEAQFMELRKNQVTEVARFFNIPPHMIMDLDKSTNNNIENQSLGFVKYTLRPYLVKIEQEIIKSLLVGLEKRRYFAKFNVEGLLRGDFKTRMEGYSTGRQMGLYSVNDILELEDMNQIDAAQGGDEHHVNAALIPLSMAGKIKTAPVPGNPVNDDPAKGGDGDGQGNTSS